MSYSYLENRTYEDALNGYLEFILREKNLLEVELIKTENAVCRISSNAIFAKISSPNYNACAMDGIAVKVRDTFLASETTPIILNKDQFQMVDTGDVVPKSFDGVIMIEDVVFKDDKAIIHSAASAFGHIRQIGEDLCKGDMILPTYTKITPSKIGALLAGGVNEIAVFKKLKIGIIPTGDELISCENEPKDGEILEFNSKIFKAILSEVGCEVKVYDIVKDKLDFIVNALLKAVKENDIVLINAGSSAGRDDYTKKAIEQIGTVFCHGIAIKPGKPTVLGISNHKPIIGVPGYPVSATLVLQYIVLPIIEKIMKNTITEKNIIKATLSRRVVSDLKYKEFIRVKLGFMEDKLIAIPLARGAGVITSLANADGILSLPLNSEGIETGETVDIELLRAENEIKNTVVISGSHDPMIDLIGDILRKNTDYFISSSHIGSMGGIMAMIKGEAHIAPVHLLDTITGEYNKSYIEKYFSGGISLIKGVKRIQGIIVKKGNPKNIKAIIDLAKENITYVNRQKGAGTRILLDFLLQKENIESEKIYGYTNEEFTHTAVAAQIANGNADAGLGILAAAKLYDLDFIPVAQEDYDFLVKESMLNNQFVKAFLKALRSDELKNKLSELGGYEF
jgi:putative molybdopterin biosynthesis protein